MKTTAAPPPPVPCFAPSLPPVPVGDPTPGTKTPASMLSLPGYVTHRIWWNSFTRVGLKITTLRQMGKLGDEKSLIAQLEEAQEALAADPDKGVFLFAALARRIKPITDALSAEECVEANWRYVKNGNAFYGLSPEHREGLGKICEIYPTPERAFPFSTRDLDITEELMEQIPAIPPDPQEVISQLMVCLVDHRESAPGCRALHADVPEAGKALEKGDISEALVCMFRAGMNAALIMAEQRRAEIEKNREYCRQRRKGGDVTREKLQLHLPESYTSTLKTVHKERPRLSFDAARRETAKRLEVSPRTAKKYLPRRPDDW